MAKEWRELNESEKLKYTELAQREKEKYDKTVKINQD